MILKARQRFLAPFIHVFHPPDERLIMFSNRLAVELRDHVLERRPVLLATSPPVLRFGAVPDELRPRRQHVVAERILVDGGQDGDRSPVARDQNGPVTSSCSSTAKARLARSRTPTVSIADQLLCGANVYLN